MPDAPTANRHVVEKPFLFGKRHTFIILLVLSDAELEESLENLPLLIAYIDQSNWNTAI
jgi:hypothetical protein